MALFNRLKKLGGRILSKTKDIGGKVISSVKNIENKPWFQAALSAAPAVLGAIPGVGGALRSGSEFLIDKYKGAKRFQEKVEKAGERAKNITRDIGGNIRRQQFSDIEQNIKDLRTVPKMVKL